MSSDVLVLNNNRLELQNAAMGTTGCLDKLLRLRLARWLPISAINCTALPLLLNIIDVEILSQPPPENPARQLKLKRHCLHILTKAMETYRQHYEGVDWVSDTIQSIVGRVRIEHAMTVQRPGAGHPSQGTDINDFLKVLMSRPFWYLRIAFILDVSLGTGRLPTDQALPRLLRGVVTKDTAPDQELNAEKDAYSNHLCTTGMEMAEASASGEVTRESTELEEAGSCKEFPSVVTPDEGTVMAGHAIAPSFFSQENYLGSFHSKNWFGDKSVALDSGVFGEGGGISLDDLDLLAFCV